MTRGIFNWTFDDVVRFLKDRDFALNDVTGSHYFYVGKSGGEIRQVCVPFHGRKAISPRTINGIIRQSGVARKEWTKK